MKIPLRQYWALLAGYLRPQWRGVTALAVLLSADIGLQLLNPQIVRYFIDTALAGGAANRLLAAASLFLLVALVTQALAVAATYTGENVAWAATNALRGDLAAHCLSLDQSFHTQRTPGELIERIDGDVTVLANFFSRLVIDVLGNLVLLAGVLALLFREDTRVGLGLTAFVLITFAVLMGLRTRAVPRWIADREASARFFGALGEQLGGREDVRANGATAYALRRFTERLRAWLPVRRRANLAGYSMWGASLALFAGANAVAFALGASLWRAGAITLGTVYLIFNYTELLRRPIERLRTQLADLQQAGASIARVTELLNLESAIRDGVGTPLPPGALAVSLDHVTFGYGAEAPVLHDVTLDLAPERVLGLLGRTGSGKTSIARLLCRLADPTVGVVYLGGVPLRDASLDELRDRVSLVTQDVQLFQGTVRDNVTFINPAIPDARIIATLDTLGLASWFRALPKGLDSELLGVDGSLSGGEAQLLAFVRVFLRDPGLVILDEASSRLDPATETLLERAIDALLAGRTAIVIAHRLATVARADEIAILEGGRIVERGERARLSGDAASRFARLLQTDLAADRDGGQMD
ncbi:MAG: ABC transporter ATP-binding protein [Thermomicrobiales bacterium]